MSLLGVPVVLSEQTLIAMARVRSRDGRLYRSIFAIDSDHSLVGLVVGLTLLLIIVAGFGHFNAHLAFDFPQEPFTSMERSLPGSALAC